MKTNQNNSMKNFKNKFKVASTNKVVLSICLIGIVLALLIYYFSKNLTYPIIVISISVGVSIAFYFYTNKKEKQEKDFDSETYKDVVKSYLEYLLSGMSPNQSMEQVTCEIRASLIKDDINKFLEDGNQEEFISSSFYKGGETRKELSSLILSSLQLDTVDDKFIDDLYSLYLKYEKETTSSIKLKPIFELLLLIIYLLLFSYYIICSIRAI